MQEIKTKSELNELVQKLKAEPNNEQLHQQAMEFLKNLEKEPSPIFDSYDEDFSDLLESLLKGGFIVSREVNFLAFRQLKLKYKEKEIEASNLEYLEKDSLLLLTLKKSINVDLEFESFLTQLRHQLLLKFLKNPEGANDILNLTAAMAEQCFNNEYIFDETVDEINEIEKLESLIPELTDIYSLLVFGMYKPLYKEQSLTNRNPATIMNVPGWGLFPTKILDNNELNETLKKLLYEPLEEQRLKEEIKSFGSISCETSLAVRSQYEENPYPRWVELNTEKRSSLDKDIKKKIADFTRPEKFYHEQLQILVAGSGTGQHPIQTAIRNPDANIIAVDLSLASLAYGKRMAKKYGVTNIEFLQGDILDIPTLNRKFHHIECVGVIHHMKDQRKAWETLESLLLPGGTIYIGIYSKVARMQVTFMRNKISNLNIKKTPEEMKIFRKKLLNDPEYKNILKLVGRGDFFSMSMFRDFLFHASEYQYSLSEIEGLIKDLDLNFIFFKLRGAMDKRYQQFFPEDINMTSFESWKKFEVHYASTCTMFSFLLQKPF